MTAIMDAKSGAPQHAPMAASRLSWIMTKPGAPLERRIDPIPTPGPGEVLLSRAPTASQVSNDVELSHAEAEGPQAAGRLRVDPLVDAHQPKPRKDRGVPVAVDGGRRSCHGNSLVINSQIGKR